jgi:cation:H+ antiporter
LLENILIFLLAIAVLVKSANVTINSLTTIAKSLDVSEFIIATVLMGTVTSLPEFFVGINSAIKNVPQIALGNVIGASILDITLVIGLPLLIAGKIKPKSKNVESSLKYLLIILILPLVFILDKTISRTEGFMLLLVFAIYIYTLLKRKRIKKITRKIIPKKIFSNSIKFLIGVALLIISSHFVVSNASIIAKNLAIPQVIVGLFMVSIGTTLPELTFGIKAVLSRHPGMVMGDAIGSTIANVLLVLGTTSLIRPITPTIKPFILGSVFLLVSALILYLIVKRGKQLNFKHGIILTSVYIIFAILEFIQ